MASQKSIIHPRIRSTYLWRVNQPTKRYTWLLSALLLVILAQLPFIAKAQSDCVLDCDKQAQKCEEDAKGVYITCGQQGGTQEECTKKKTDYLATCGCERCSKITPDTYRTGLMKTWWCKCGEPYDEADTDSNPCSFALAVSGSDCDSPLAKGYRSDRAPRFTSAAAGVDFDLNTDGVKERIAWTREGDDCDVWIVHDADNNGLIDNGTELFGSVDGFANGFEKLAALFDSNHDRVVDARDANYILLKAWRDANHNGISEPRELRPLADAGIDAIPLDYHQSRHQDPFGNWLRLKAGSFTDVWLIRQ
jgi:hypothetical protein